MNPVSERRPERVVETAPAKINLALHVTGRRDDGYHLLDSLVVFADVGDRVSVAPAAELGPKLGLTLAGPAAEGLRAELRPQGVDVIACAPGPIASGFAARADMVMGMSQPASVVAAATLDALGRRGTIRPGECPSG